MRSNNDNKTFWTLVRKELWEQEVWHELLREGEYTYVYRLAYQQSVVGLVTMGLEQVADAKAPKEIAMRCMSTVLSLEQRNLAMNAFIADFFSKDVRCRH